MHLTDLSLDINPVPGHAGVGPVGLRRDTSDSS